MEGRFVREAAFAICASAPCEPVGHDGDRALVDLGLVPFLKRAVVGAARCQP